MISVCWYWNQYWCVHGIWLGVHLYWKSVAKPSAAIICSGRAWTERESAALFSIMFANSDQLSTTQPHSYCQLIKIRCANLVLILKKVVLCKKMFDLLMEKLRIIDVTLSTTGIYRHRSDISVASFPPTDHRYLSRIANGTQWKLSLSKKPVQLYFC